MDVLTPVRVAPTPSRALAPRRGTLAGARIGVLDNSKPNADTLLGRLAELLAERHGAASIARWQKPGASRPAAVVDEVVAGSDLVLTGSAD
jgi:hypothetical protein